MKCNKLGFVPVDCSNGVLGTDLLGTRCMVIFNTLSHQKLGSSSCSSPFPSTFCFVSLHLHFDEEYQQWCIVQESHIFMPKHKRISLEISPVILCQNTKEYSLISDLLLEIELSTCIHWTEVEHALISNLH